METKFSNSELVHKFAERSQSNGESCNMFFRNTNEIYSYGYHYLLGKFLDINGETCILIDNRGYSSTTSKHISLLRQATRHFKQYFTLDVEFRHVESSILGNYKSLLKAKKPELYIGQIINKFESLINYPLFDTKLKKEDKFKAIEKIYKSVSNPEQIAKAKEVQKANEIKAKKAAAKKLKEDLKKFENYEIDYLTNEEDFLRISLDKIQVETSQCVKVSIQEAKLLYSMILANRDIKGHRIGNYTVISINGTLKIGCHHINIESMHKVGKQILNY